MSWIARLDLSLSEVPTTVQSLLISPCVRANCRALWSTDVRERYDTVDVRVWALGVILEDCVSGLKSATPVVVPNTATDSAAAHASAVLLSRSAK